MYKTATINSRLLNLNKFPRPSYNWNKYQKPDWLISHNKVENPLTGRALTLTGASARGGVCVYQLVSAVCAPKYEWYMAQAAQLEILKEADGTCCACVVKTSLENSFQPFFFRPSNENPIWWFRLEPKLVISRNNGLRR